MEGTGESREGFVWAEGSDVADRLVSRGFGGMGRLEREGDFKVCRSISMMEPSSVGTFICRDGGTLGVDFWNRERPRQLSVLL